MWVSVGVHLRAFLGDPKGVASLLPTSLATVGRIVSKAPVEEADLIVEFGPGSGVVTRGLLRRMRPEARLVAIEANEEFAERLTAELGDRRLSVEHDAAERVGEILDARGLGPADCVFSGIPFFWLDWEQARSIVANTEAALAPGGVFVAYQMFYQPRRCLRDHLDACFRSVRSELDLPSFSPYRISAATK